MTPIPFSLIWIMRYIRVYFNDGSTLETSINGTENEIRNYYIGQMFNIGNEKEDKMVIGQSVIFLN